jgi:hypothetical protein
LDNDHLPAANVDALDVGGQRERLVEANTVRLLRRGRVYESSSCRITHRIPAMSVDCTEASRAAGSQRP